MSNCVLDVSRLIVRNFKQKTNTGVDNVLLGYLENLDFQKILFFRFHFLIIVFDSKSSDILTKKLINKERISMILFLILSLRSSLNFFKLLQNKTNYFLNLGHYNLDKKWVFYLMKLMATNIVVLIHDLIPITHPEFSKNKETEKHKKRINNSANLSDKVICLSHETKFQFEKYLSKNKVTINADLKIIHPASELKFSITYPREHYIMVGTIEPRKGYIDILKMWQTTDAKYPLVIIGQKGWMCDEEINLMKQLQKSGKVIWEKECSDEKLLEYYSKSRALIQNSYYEGFGLPVLEAINNRLVVFAREIAAILEFDNTTIKKYKNLKELKSFINDESLIDDVAETETKRVWLDAANELKSYLAK